MSGYCSFAGVYDLLTQNVDYDGRVDYYVRLLERNGVKSGMLLDIACGTGSMSVRMAQKGFEVIGIDLSPDMLCEAQNKAIEAGENILFLCQDMCELDLYGTADAAICALDAVNHLTSQEQVGHFFSRLSLFLNPGAVFVFDVNTPFKHREILGDNSFVYDCDEVYCVWQNSLNRETDTVDITLDIFEEDDGAYYRSTEEFSERAYALNVLESLLEKSGFKVIEVLDEMTLELPKSDSQRLFIVTKKL